MLDDFNHRGIDQKITVDQLFISGLVFAGLHQTGLQTIMQRTLDIAVDIITDHQHFIRLAIDRGLHLLKKAAEGLPMMIA